ncbi:hypothetical protein DdX_03016 [Ditylenchus destructor]|uniref:Uncharacterized protein n=1 Tax=Ditylenchus destructor TaxID=166010 RepID=A0AAD4RCN2_9BILA|nr:hypothetical protein DdX_03016 [Ditylenchus destructor]
MVGMIFIAKKTLTLGWENGYIKAKRAQHKYSPFGMSHFRRQPENHRITQQRRGQSTQTVQHCYIQNGHSTTNAGAMKTARIAC